ncbi:hypothetical protein ACDZ28_32600 [Paenibacillus sp. RS8]|uniref:hypothetical protein n=1 Tax=Paenibacillus sp. RS8 TaxID=3242681 RepID=UPI0035C19955
MDTTQKALKGVFAPIGYWEGGDGTLKEISEMDVSYKRNVVYHLKNSLHQLDHFKQCGGFGNGPQIYEFGGKYSRDVADKFIELGEEVEEISSDKFSVLRGY